ncbi:MAG: ABC transporter substrate-binding protein, partial [Rhodococcus sp. (in: high G+C Gram-positive bacteria)]
MSKTFLGVSALITSALLLTACGGLGSTTTEETSASAAVPELADDQSVSIVFESYNYGLAGAWTDTFNTLIDEFHEQHPNI